jgi:hypothetical protein
MPMKSLLFSTSLLLVLCTVSACSSGTQATTSESTTADQTSMSSEVVLAQIGTDSPMARNTGRMYEMQMYAIAAQDYFMKKNRTFPEGITMEPQKICKYKTPCDGVNLDILVDGGYMSELPFDDASTTNDTGYTIRIYNNRTQLFSLLAEDGVELKTR